MTLTPKQRAKINAALCLIHDNGHNANAVTSMARSIMAGGADPRSAYERALNTFAETNPALLPALSKVVGLVEASDDDTVAKYDAALSSYIETGDDSAVRSLAPMIAQDMTTLATRNGEQPPEFAQEFQEAANAAPVPRAVEHRTSTFAFSDQPASNSLSGRPIVGRANDGSPIVRTTSQISMGGGVTGMVAPKAQAAWQNTPYVGPLSATRAPNDLNPNNAREAARAMAANGSRAIIDGTVGQVA